MQPIPPETNEIARQIVDAAYSVHTALGPDLLENVSKSAWPTSCANEA